MSKNHTTSPDEMKSVPFSEVAEILAEYERLKLNPVTMVKVYAPTKRKEVKKLMNSIYDRSVVEVLKDVINLLKML